MNVDLSQLTPAPWRIKHGTKNPHIRGPQNEYINEFGYGPRKEADAAFIALARNAFDVLMRRPWGVECIFWGDGPRTFQAIDESDDPIGDTEAPDPFTALVEADRWYRENVENPGTPPTV